MRTKNISWYELLLIGCWWSPISLAVGYGCWWCPISLILIVNCIIHLDPISEFAHNLLVLNVNDAARFYLNAKMSMENGFTILMVIRAYTCVSLVLIVDWSHLGENDWFCRPSWILRFQFDFLFPGNLGWFLI